MSGVSLMRSSVLAIDIVLRSCTFRMKIIVMNLGFYQRLYTLIPLVYAAKKGDDNTVLSRRKDFLSPFLSPRKAWIKVSVRQIQDHFVILVYVI